MVLKMHGMNTARNRLRNITKTEKRMDFGLNRLKMEGKHLKKYSRMD